MTSDRDEFLAQYQTGQALEGAFSKRLTDAISAQPTFGDREAIAAWLPTIVGALQDYKRWGEAFVRLIDSTPADVLAGLPGVRASRASAQIAIDEMDARLQELGFSDDP